MVNYLSSSGFPFVIILTKSDKLKKMEKDKRIEKIRAELAEFENLKLIPFSSVSSEGLEDIKNEIVKYVDI